ncbi:MAG: TonB-dependent receptor [Flavobacterium sp.]|nr:TonB-dependent receptor [Flavobacterium sp.]
MKKLFKQSYKVTKLQRFKAGTSCFLLLASFLSSAQQKEQDTTKVNQLDDVLVTAVRATIKTPVSFSNLSKEEIASRNLGQDIPILMNFLPSVVTTSDAGNGVGYTGIRVRGSDATRVNVTINGIPYNDSESHGTYWVNMPDFASSTESLQLQRGVGTSTNGAGAFGASLNVLTDSYSKDANGEISNSFGSFNTRKHTVKFSTGLLNDHFEIAGRLSNIDSHGYIDRGFSELHSYFLQGTYVGKTTLIKALVFGGKERTYQSWNGIDAATLESDRTFNPSGIYTDESGNTRYYDNETDNYQQDHYQLHWNEKCNENWSLNLALHYTKGKGYYENYKEDADFADYGLLPVGAETTTDLIRQKWLDNDFYGYTFSVNYKKEKLDLLIGGGWNKYEGAHFGEVIWARFASQSELGDHYYDDYADKTDGNIFAKANYQITNKISLFGDLQFRNVTYKADGVQTEPVDDNFSFFNPKAGLNYALNDKNIFYFSYAIANREPNRTDYEGGSVKPEKLSDFELGWRLAASKIKLNINGYYMLYKDQLVLTGALDDVGSPIRTNVGKSYRMGVEVDAAVRLLKKWSWRPNITVSSNKNKDFVIDNGSGLEDLGNTNIAYSPNVIVGNMLIFQPSDNWSMALMTKFVSEQYMSNIDDQNSKLEAYTQTDFSISYELKPKKVFKSIVFTGLLNNIFDEKYVSNGADYGGGYIYYFPQAGINFLVGMTLKF